MQRELQCCYFGLFLSLYGGQKWTPGKAINKIFRGTVIDAFESISREESESMDQMMKAGMSFVEIAQIYGVTENTAWKAWDRRINKGL